MTDYGAFKTIEQRWLQGFFNGAAWGARCTTCDEWLTKNDFSEDDSVRFAAHALRNNRHKCRG